MLISELDEQSYHLYSFILKTRTTKGNHQRVKILNRYKERKKFNRRLLTKVQLGNEWELLPTQRNASSHQITIRLDRLLNLKAIILNSK